MLTKILLDQNNVPKQHIFSDFEEINCKNTDFENMDQLEVADENEKYLFKILTDFSQKILK